MTARLSSQKLLFVAVGLALGAHACSNGPVADDRIVLHAPSSNQFVNGGPGVLLENKCGTLDCHGSFARNMRLYGKEGLRIDDRTDPSQPVPLPGSTETTLNELYADYHSVVGLEPEVMTQVTKDGGAQPERLTMIRKARGTEEHKGLQQWSVGDDSDVCITSWLAGTVNSDACNRAIALIDPPPP